MKGPQVDRKHQREIQVLERDIEVIKGPKLYLEHLEQVWAFLQLPNSEFAKLEDDTANNEPWVGLLENLAVTIRHHRSIQEEQSKKRFGLSL